MSAIGDDGFTLLEMLVTLAVVALVASIGFPALQSSSDRMEFNRTVTETGYALRAARALAIGRGTRVHLVKLDDGRLVAAGNTFAQAAPQSVKVTMPAGGLAFFPDGEALPGEVTVRSGNTVRRIVVRADGLVE